MKDESNASGHPGPGVGEAVQQQGEGGSSAEALSAGGQAASGHRLAGAALGPTALTDGERKAFRMGVLAAGAVYADAACAGGHNPRTPYKCGCYERLQNVRIAIAARGIDCEAPEFWPTRGEE